MFKPKELARGAGAGKTFFEPSLILSKGKSILIQHRRLHPHHPSAAPSMSRFENHLVARSP